MGLPWASYDKCASVYVLAHTHYNTGGIQF